MTELLADPQVWIAFLTLTALELVLGIDNVIFISILVDKLPPGRRELARRIGLFLAMFMRIGLLFVLTWIIGLTQPLFSLFQQGLSGRDLILIGGGLFLLWKSDLTIWSCFCLSALKNRKLDEFQTLADAQSYYRKVWGVYQDTVYPLDQCYHCYYREKWGCQGGCLTYAIMKDHGGRYAAEQPEPCADHLDSGLELCLAEDVRVFHYDLPKPTFVFRKTSANLDFEIDAAFAPVLPLLDGQHTLDEIIGALPAPTGGRISYGFF